MKIQLVFLTFLITITLSDLVNSAPAEEVSVDDYKPRKHPIRHAGHHGGHRLEEDHQSLDANPGQSDPVSTKLNPGEVPKENGGKKSGEDNKSISDMANAFGKDEDAVRNVETTIGILTKEEDKATKKAGDDERTTNSGPRVIQTLSDLEQDGDDEETLQIKRQKLRHRHHGLGDDTLEYLKKHSKNDSDYVFKKVKVIRFKLEASNLEYKNYEWGPNAFVVVSYTDVNHKTPKFLGKTPVISETHTPVWPVHFKFRYNKGKNQRFLFSIYHKSMFGAEDELLGTASTKVKHYLDKGEKAVLEVTPTSLARGDTPKIESNIELKPTLLIYKY